MTKLLLGLLGAIIIISGSIWFFSIQKGVKKNNPVACTEEAKLCPDGSAVGRTGPNCEFAACPILSTPTLTPTLVPILIPPTVIIPIKKIESGYVAGHVTIGPFCPVESIDHPCTVPPEAYTSRSVVIYQSNGITEKERIALDKNGNYKITLDPGKYFAQIQPAGIGPGEKKPFSILSFQTVIVNFNIDTGIR